MNEPLLILASSSPRRQELIRSLGLAFDIRVSDADETTPLGMAPADIVRTLAKRKAQVVFSNLTGGSSVIIGADTIVVCEGEVLGKPHDEEDAFRMLRKLAGRTHEVYSGIALIGQGETGGESGLVEEIRYGIAGGYRIIARKPDNRPASLLGWSMTKVRFKPLSDGEIIRYIARGESADKAGAYAIQNVGATLVDGIEGDYFTVVGLPISLLAEMLSQLDIAVL